MQISMILSDFATGHPDGTFSLLRGGIDRVICAPGGPLTFRGVLLVHIRPDLDDFGKEFGWSASMVDGDGGSAHPPHTGVVNFPASGEKKIHGFNITSHFGAVFPKTGRYEIRFRVNGEQKAVWPLEVEVLREGTAQSQGSFEPSKPWTPVS